MVDTPTVADGKVVTIHYTLHLDGGRQVDSSEGQEPMAYLHGHGNIVPGLERALHGASIGDKLNVKIAPKDGYGKAMPDAVQEVPTEAFPPDFNPEPGMSFAAQDEDGNVMPLWVVSVAGDTVTITPNHPLAGENLNFSVEVMAIRDAAAEELEHGHPHGPGGHQH